MSVDRYKSVAKAAIDVELEQHTDFSREMVIWTVVYILLPFEFIQQTISAVADAIWQVVRLFLLDVSLPHRIVISVVVWCLISGTHDSLVKLRKLVQ
jgi:hypothetical protein